LDLNFKRDDYYYATEDRNKYDENYIRKSFNSNIRRMFTTKYHPPVSSSTSAINKATMLRTPASSLYHGNVGNGTPMVNDLFITHPGTIGAFNPPLQAQFQNIIQNDDNQHFFYNNKLNYPIVLNSNNKKLSTSFEKALNLIDQSSMMPQKIFFYNDQKYMSVPKQTSTPTKQFDKEVAIQKRFNALHTPTVDDDEDGDETDKTSVSTRTRSIENLNDERNYVGKKIKSKNKLKKLIKNLKEKLNLNKKSATSTVTLGSSTAANLNNGSFSSLRTTTSTIASNNTNKTNDTSSVSSKDNRDIITRIYKSYHKRFRNVEHNEQQQSQQQQQHHITPNVPTPHQQARATTPQQQARATPVHLPFSRTKFSSSFKQVININSHQDSSSYQLFSSLFFFGSLR
jgi:hypothetical protein